MTEYTCVRIDIENKEILNDIQYKTLKRTHKRISYNNILSELLDMYKAHLYTLYRYNSHNRNHFFLCILSGNIQTDIRQIKWTSRPFPSSN